MALLSPSVRATSTGRISDDGVTAVEPRRVDRAAFEREFRSGDATATECAQNLMRAAELFTGADSRGLRRHGLSIAARIGHTVLWRSSKGLASGWWDIALFAASVVAAMTVGGFAPLVRNMRRRRSS